MATTKAGPQATTSLSNWRFWDQHVQSDMPGGNFVNAASTLLAAGPPRLSQATGGTDGTEDAGMQNLTARNLAFPIGVVENFALNQNRMIQKLFEIGSKRAYHIPGRTVGNISLGRVLYWGPSLMRTMYAYYPVVKINNGGASGANKLDQTELTGNDRITPNIKDIPGYGASAENTATVEPENSDFFINLASDLFDHPLGLMVYLRDAEDEPYGAFYLEDCYIQAHSFNINASSVLIAEGVSCQYDRLVPINIKSAVMSSDSTRATS
jgi:hypothetical protein